MSNTLYRFREWVHAYRSGWYFLLIPILMEVNILEMNGWSVISLALTILPLIILWLEYRWSKGRAWKEDYYRPRYFLTFDRDQGDDWEFASERVLAICRKNNFDISYVGQSTKRTIYFTHLEDITLVKLSI